MIEHTSSVHTFLQSQRILSLATQDADSHQLWMANLFYVADEHGQVFFVSSTETIHSQHISKNPEVAFSIHWYNEQNHEDRKGVQGLGSCFREKDPQLVQAVMQQHNTLFPEFAEMLTSQWVLDGSNHTALWHIQPTYLKHWDDTQYGTERTKELYLS